MKLGYSGSAQETSSANLEALKQEAIGRIGRERRERGALTSEVMEEADAWAAKVIKERRDGLEASLRASMNHDVGVWASKGRLGDKRLVAQPEVLEETADFESGDIVLTLTREFEAH